jgi:hypothetical protein
MITNKFKPSSKGWWILALLLIVTGISQCSHWFDPCSNQIWLELISPDQRFKAVVFQRDCGTATEFNTQIAIIPIEEKLSDEGKVLVQTGMYDHNKLQLRWRNRMELEVIRHEKAKKVYVQMEQWGHVSILYRDILPSSEPITKN